MPKRKESVKPVPKKGDTAKVAAKGSKKKSEEVPKVIKPRGRSVNPKVKESEETAIVERASRYESVPAKFSAEYSASAKRKSEMVARPQGRIGQEGVDESSLRKSSRLAKKVRAIAGLGRGRHRAKRDSWEAEDKGRRR